MLIFTSHLTSPIIVLMNSTITLQPEAKEHII